MEKVFTSYNDLVALGFPKEQARRIIRIAKTTLVSRGIEFYNGKRVGLVPTSVVSEILDASLNQEER
ncbi:DUF3173 family protein [Levilactobacillus tujiorum]|uniref:DUF3173 family protein n=1 Tax=Levilactobacillus tujiorum TaxID=2912243 RepID=UPI001456E992|nr:DUF3173 family protein [Levilactobacillus tujiorum]NLR31611.1 DUF3173 family protein [Levilactobacillus tujiorum]